MYYTPFSNMMEFTVGVICSFQALDAPCDLSKIKLLKQPLKIILQKLYNYDDAKSDGVGDSRRTRPVVNSARRQLGP